MIQHLNIYIMICNMAMFHHDYFGVLMWGKVFLASFMNTYNSSGTVGRASDLWFFFSIRLLSALRGHSFFHPATTANDLRLRRPMIDLSWVRALSKATAACFLEPKYHILIAQYWLVKGMDSSMIYIPKVACIKNQSK